MKAVHQLLDWSEHISKYRLRGGKKQNPKKKSPSENQTGKKKTPTSLFRWARSLPGRAPLNCRQSSPAQMWGSKLCQQGDVEWGLAVFQCTASMAQVPCPSTTGSKVLTVPAWALAHGPTTCTESCWSFALPRSLGICSLSGAGRISPHGHTPPPGCMCMWVFVYIQTLYSTKYLQEGIFSL